MIVIMGFSSFLFCVDCLIRCNKKIELTIPEDPYESKIPSSNP